MNKGKLVFLKQFINENASLHGDNSKVILKILIAVQKASTKVHTSINKAGIEDILGAAGAENIQGEQVQKLDLFANDQFIKELKEIDHIAAIASEENEEIITLNDTGAVSYTHLTLPTSVPV